MGWEKVVEELEGATEELFSIELEDYPRLMEAMNRRSRIAQRIQKLAESGQPVPPGINERIQGDLRRGGGLQEKLLLARAAARAEISRTAEAGYLMRALARATAGAGRRVNCTG